MAVRFGGGVPGFGEPRRTGGLGSAGAVLRDRVAGRDPRPDGVSLTMTFAEQFLAEAAEILTRIDTGAVERVAALLAECRTRGGRLFILGVGGSAANASHAVNDFRKICGMEAYAPTDNVSELTARTNDEGWAGVFEAWLKVSRLRA